MLAVKSCFKSFASISFASMASRSENRSPLDSFQSSHFRLASSLSNSANDNNVIREIIWTRDSFLLQSKAKQNKKPSPWLYVDNSANTNLTGKREEKKGEIK